MQTIPSSTLIGAKSKTEIEITLPNDLNRISDWMK